MATKVALDISLRIVGSLAGNEFRSISISDEVDGVALSRRKGRYLSSKPDKTPAGASQLES